MIDEKVINTVAAGALLKVYREKLDLSQGDIASQLGYRNINFISMIESGKSQIPIARLADVVNAYQIDAEMTLVLLRKLQPELWSLFKHIIMQNPEICKKDFKTIEKEVDVRFNNVLKTLGLNKIANATS